MEANLNQFRMLTVDGEQKANDQRGGKDGPSGKRYNRQRSDDDMPTSFTPKQRIAAATAGIEEDTLPSDVPSGKNLRETALRDDDKACDGGEDGQKSEASTADGGVMCGTGEDDTEDFNTNDELGNQKGLVGALLSLERTITQHCQLLNKRLAQERASIKIKTTTDTSRTPAGAIGTPPMQLPKTAIRTDKVIVYIRVVFLKIGEIDTMKENFMADAFIQAKWREPALDGLASTVRGAQKMKEEHEKIPSNVFTAMNLKNIDDIEWDKFWNPKLYVENNLGEPKETIWQTVTFNAKGDATVYERRRIKGCFLENLELDEFPFDTQDLTLTISTERAEAELELEEDTNEISSINVQSFVDEQEWELHSHVETWKKITTKVYQNSKFKHPSFSTSCRASRRPGFFIWNIFLVMLFICSLTFATFSVELTKPENRLQLSFILLLTTITFKFVVSQTLPRISYLTYLDKYILTSMGILCGVCVWHAVIPLFKFNYGNDTAKTVDKWGLIVSGTSYFLFHICFFMYIYLVALKKRWKYDQKDKDHKERIKKLQRLQESANAASGAAPADASSAAAALAGPASSKGDNPV